MTKPRTGIPGITGLSKVVNSNAWGEAKALERTKPYGGLKQQDTRPPDQSAPLARSRISRTMRITEIAKAVAFLAAGLLTAIFMQSLASWLLG
jgi:hypothetical protein